MTSPSRARPSDRAIAQAFKEWSSYPNDDGSVEERAAHDKTEAYIWKRARELEPHPAPEQPGKGVPPKPFPALGAWYPVNILGYPMREFAPDKWESASWPSEQPSNGGAALRKYVATLRKAHEHGATDADLAFKCAADDIERILGTPQPSDQAEGAAYMAKELGEVGTCGEQQ